MLQFAVLGLILWISVLLWRINTKSVAMPVKGEESLSSCGPQAAEEDMSTSKTAPRADTYSPSAAAVKLNHNENNNLLANGSAGCAFKPEECDPPQASSKVNPEQPSPLQATQKPLVANTPMHDSGPETRERLKFILGASEDNSSDEEVTKPPDDDAQPLISALKSGLKSPTVTPPSSSVIK